VPVAKLDSLIDPKPSGAGERFRNAPNPDARLFFSAADRIENHMQSPGEQNPPGQSWAGSVVNWSRREPDGTRIF
jgi:hypothetical protein